MFLVHLTFFLFGAWMLTLVASMLRSSYLLSSSSHQQAISSRSRHLISFNKVTLGNLAALELLMINNHRYEHAHVIFHDVVDPRGAAGHFYDWVAHFGQERTEGPSSRYTTYRDDNTPLRHQNDIGVDPIFLGVAKDADFNSMRQLQITESVIYDIHQTSTISLEEHQFLHDHIRRYGGHLGTLYLSHCDEMIGTSTSKERAWSGYPAHVGAVYDDKVERIVYLCPDEDLKKEALLPANILKPRLPEEHVKYATVDASNFKAAIQTLLEINEYTFGRESAVEHLPRALRDILPRPRNDDSDNDDDAGYRLSKIDLVQHLVLASLSSGSKKSSVRRALIADIPLATQLASFHVSSENSHLVQEIERKVRRLEIVADRLQLEKGKTDKVDFVDAALAVVVLDPSRYRSSHYHLDESALPSSSQHSNSVLPGGGVSDVGVHDHQTSRVVMYKDLHSGDLVRTALALFPERTHDWKTKVRAWFGRQKKH